MCDRTANVLELVDILLRHRRKALEFGHLRLRGRLFRVRHLGVTLLIGLNEPGIQHGLFGDAVTHQDQSKSLLSGEALIRFARILDRRKRLLDLDVVMQDQREPVIGTGHGLRLRARLGSGCIALRRRNRRHDLVN